LLSVLLAAAAASAADKPPRPLTAFWSIDSGQCDHARHDEDPSSR
jgi:hypothetical protein